MVKVGDERMTSGQVSFFFNCFYLHLIRKRRRGDEKGTAGSPHCCGPKSHESVCCSLSDLSTLSGPVHGAPGNPAQRNMVAAMSIHRHTHNHMPPLSFQ